MDEKDSEITQKDNIPPPVAGLEDFYTDGTSAIERTSFYKRSVFSDNPAVIPDEIELERNIENYIKKKLLGKGGMKSVYKAYDKTMKRQLALAESNTYSDNLSKKQFLYEARITAGLEHPNIVPVYEIGSNGAGFYFTMKLIEGENLALILKKLSLKDSVYKNKYPKSELLQIYIKICGAIAFAHSRGIAHMDLKPSNIMVGEYGEVLVMDWGLAKVIKPQVFVGNDEDKDNSDWQKLSSNKTVVGSPGYMAPEQALGEYEITGISTDIYSLGAILYSILTLSSPIERKTIKEALKATIAGEIVPPSLRVPDMKIPEPLEAIVMKAMALFPNERYQLVNDIINDIQAYLNGYAPKAQDISFTHSLKLFVLRHRKFIVIRAGIILFVSFLSIAFFYRLVLSDKIIRSQKVSINRGEELLRRQVALKLKNYDILIFAAEKELKHHNFVMAIDHLERAYMLMPSEELKKQILTLLQQVIDIHLKADNSEAASIFQQKKKKYNNDLLQKSNFLQDE